MASHYGNDAVEYLAEPLLAGVYGGDPEKLSVASVLPRFVELERKYGSLTKGVLHERRGVARAAKGAPLFQTLKGGLGQLVEALAAETRPAPEVVRGAAEALASRDGGGYRLRVNGEWLDADHVVLACQAYQAGALLGALDGELARNLDAIPYSNSITIALGYRRREFKHPLNGFGFLVPKKERKLLVACTWVGTKFSHRVPDSKVVLRCFVGGEDPASLALSDQELESRVNGRTARPHGRDRDAGVRAHRALAAFDGAVPVGHARGSVRSKRAWRSYPVCTWWATPITASAFPTVSVWAGKRLKPSSTPRIRAALRDRSGQHGLDEPGTALAHGVSRTARRTRRRCGRATLRRRARRRASPNRSRGSPMSIMPLASGPGAPAPVRRISTSRMR